MEEANGQKDSPLLKSGHILGNFPNYYEFNTVEERLSIVKPILNSCIVNDLPNNNLLKYLDVGCNDGSLTSSIHSSLFSTLSQLQVGLQSLGVDVDSELISKGANIFPQISLRALDVMNLNHRTSFYLEEEQFDLVSCFGVTMWIHLNHGDTGLTEFLDFLKRITKQTLILEPQRYKSYKTARRRITVLQNSTSVSSKSVFKFKQLNIGGDQLDGFILERLLTATDVAGTPPFRSKELLGETKWSRQVWLLRK